MAGTFTRFAPEVRIWRASLGRVYAAVTEFRRDGLFSAFRADVFPTTSMSYLKTIPRSFDIDPRAMAVAVVSSDARDVVYVDQPASIEIITEALEAWGIRVRAERSEEATAPVQHTPSDANWETTRSEAKAPTRLENALSPLWLPIRTPSSGSEPVAAWSWFGRAA